jgi:hypothetical protein
VSARVLVAVAVFVGGASAEFPCMGLVHAAQIIAGDMNADGQVTWDDLPGFFAAWHQAHAGQGIRAGADIFPDRQVNWRDAELLLDGIMRGGQGNWQPDDSMTFNVEWDPNATVIGPSHACLMLKSADDTGQYVLDAAAVRNAGLDVSPGKVLVIHGIGVRKVRTVQKVGPNLVVDTDYAALTEAVRNADISWNYGIVFGADRVAPQALATNFPLPAQGTYQPNVTFQVGDYELQIEMSLDDAATPKKLTFTFTLSKSIGQAKVQAVCEGELNSFRSVGDISIRGNQLSDWHGNANGIQGKASLSLIMLASGRDVIDFKPELPLVKFPFLVGWLPVTIGIGAQFVINASVPFDGSVRVQADFTYDSDLGFKYEGSKIISNTGVRSYEIGKKGEPATGASSAIAGNFGVGFPRLSLSLGTKPLAEVIGWMQPAFLVGGDFVIFPQPPCQRAQALFLLAGGAELTFFGLGSVNATITFFRQEKELLNTCPGASGASLSAFKDLGVPSLLSGMIPRDLVK